MNEQEKSLFDEIWEAAGLKEEQPAEVEMIIDEIPDPIVEEPIVEEPVVEEPIVEEPVVEAPVEEPIAEEVPAKKPKAKKEKAEKPKKQKKVKKEKKIKEKPEKEPKKEKNPTVDHAEKKKSVKFLVIYTIVFVIVISALVSGSYMISQRIHMEHNEAQNGRDHQSHLQNIKDKNEALTKENAELKEQNENLIASEKDATDLLDSTADMIEHQEYLTAAMAEYIDGNRADARSILAAVDREKLSPPAKEYYDLLDQKLN